MGHNSITPWENVHWTFGGGGVKAVDVINCKKVAVIELLDFELLNLEILDLRLF